MVIPPIEHPRLILDGSVEVIGLLLRLDMELRPGSAASFADL
jgi:hypothetical protein